MPVEDDKTGIYVKRQKLKTNQCCTIISVKYDKKYSKLEYRLAKIIDPNWWWWFDQECVSLDEAEKQQWGESSLQKQTSLVDVPTKATD